MDDVCRKCGSKCCKYFCFEIDEPEAYDEFEDVRWYLAHQGVTVHIDEGDWYISIMNPCTKLDAAGRCTIYDDRPLICRRYDTENCDYTQGDYGYDQEFTSAEELDAYARKTLGEKKYEKAKAKARAKLAKAAEKSAKKKSKKDGKGKKAKKK